MQLVYSLSALSIASGTIFSRSGLFPSVEYGGTVYQYPVLSGAVPTPSKLDLSTVNYISATRGFDKFDRDFVMEVSPSKNLHSSPLFLRLDINEGASWVHSRVNEGNAYSASIVAPSRQQCMMMGKLRNGVLLSLCEAVDETLIAGQGFAWEQRLWINPIDGSGIAGSIGANRNSGFFNNFLMYPRDREMILVPNPSSEVVSRACKTRMTYVDAMVGSEWQVEGFVGISGIHGVFSKLTLATKGPIELSVTAFEIFRQKVAQTGSYLTHVGDRTSYQAANCAALGPKFPSIAVEIGEFVAVIKPEHYLRYSPDLPRGFCHVDIMKSKRADVLAVGPSLLRNVVTHLANKKIGLCVAQQ